VAHGSSAPEAPGGPAGPALDNNAKSVRHRVDRWEARGFLWEYSSIPRVRKCGRVTVTPDGSVGVRANGESVGFAGLHTCGSVWACPCCNSRVQRFRGLELGVALASLHANGGGAAFGAFTLRHHQGQALPYLFESLAYSSQRIARDRTVRRLRESMGYLGTITASEVTWGQSNGFHPHRHPIVAFDRPPAPDALVELHFAMRRAWIAGAVRKGLEAPLDTHQVLMPVGFDGLGDYLTKSTWSPEGVASEATFSQAKKGRRKGLTPWQLLEYARKGDADALDVWNAYEKGSKGRRALTWAPGLRDRLGIGSEASDEEIASEEVGDASDTGFRITDWGAVVRRPAAGAELLNAVTPAGDWSAGRAYCRTHGIPFEDAS
jgi:hypothetical protein